MYDVSAFAIQNKEVVEVTINGFLANSCHRAIIADIFPGGNRQYPAHPGEAQVFIKEWASNEGVLCAMALVPWSATVTIPSSGFPISIYINGEKVITINATTQNDQFCVWELTGGIVPPNGSYSILPDSVKLPSVWTKQFGPANYKACLEWVLKHGALAATVQKALDGGGSGSPRGRSEPRFVY